MLEQELALAHELADRAAEISLGLFRGTFEVAIKPDATPVTEADLAIEAMIRDELARRFPNDAILGEEHGGAIGKAERTWIVDPIDGTKNFADGVPIWATLIGLQIGDRLELGVASAAALGERYWAVRGAGSHCNGEPIHVREEVTAVPAAFVCLTELDELLDTPLREPFLDLTRRCRRTRAFGDFWGHCLVARGAADVMIEPELAIWDYAALVPIVEEAGGRVSQLDGSPLRPGASVVSTNGVLHDEILAIVGT
ncbi:MAG: inositol monophosphatase family protein [Actinomycetota bacterium]